MATQIYGRNPILAAMDANRKIYELYTLENQNHEILDRAKAEGIKIKVLPKQKMNQMFTHAHQGFAALVEDYQTIPLKQALKKSGPKLFVMLDSLEDPHNLGAILRSADAFGVTGVIIPKNRSVQITPTVIKVSTGAIEYVDIVSVTNLNHAIDELKKNNIWVVGLDLDTPQTLDDIQVDTDLCVVLGSEGKGISRLVKENCDYTVQIPMVGHVNSLNVSVTAGIVIHDIVKRRG